MTDPSGPAPGIAVFHPDSPSAWRRLRLALAIGTVGSIGLWSVVLVMPMVQADLGGTRGEASLAYTATMVGFGLGGVLTGRLTDRLGIVPAMGLGIVSLVFGFLVAAASMALWQFAAACLFVGLGASATFAPLMAEASHWFVRRRGIAIAIAGTGYYLSGALWPPLIEHSLGAYGWRGVHIALALLCGTVMAGLVLVLRSVAGRAPRKLEVSHAPPGVDLGLGANAITAILSIASFTCCVAMAVPQVHIVALCFELGYGTASGAGMLSVMLAFAVLSRIGTGFIADRLGGLGALLIGSLAQASALSMYLAFDGLTSLYVVSALFGLFHGGIVPCYAIIVRETMPAQDAAARVGTVIMVSLVGMAFGGWIAGTIFDRAGSYDAAFLNALAWNMANAAIVLLLLARARGRALRNVSSN
ncbi:MFS transporter [Fulvimarina sp. 2208YS6-2-32]|uniref:MFS transporter n=1 Tax=Fulvimarina uroteuthidis TaxID=3098149 RepID=A0ABU5I2R9_9HYPH|nr:MFS transporter [Fulvimarina sp. 2208YS6-2-32]MDY8109263.1 MFS transporter [Fulvimarina sp. 2208YS6-2-32]